MGGRRDNPFRGFVDVMSEMNRIREMGTYGNEAVVGPAGRQRDHANAWVPSADIFARGGDLVIRLELAGVDREDIDLTFHDNVLTVSGERVRDLDDDAMVYVHERYYGAFRRSMTVPAGVAEDDISAYSDNGTLEITIEGGAAAEPRRIRIEDKPG